MRKYKSFYIFLSFSFCLILIFSFTFSSFASVLPSYRFYLDNLDKDGASSFTASRDNFGGHSCTAISTNTNGNVILFYSVPSGLINGQTYEFKSKLYRQSGSNFNFHAGCSYEKPLNGNTWFENPTYTWHLTPVAPNYPANGWRDFEFSFVYNGAPYIAIVLQVTSQSNNNQNFHVWFDEFLVYQYNPFSAGSNEVVSQLEDNQNQVNSHFDEQNSVIQSNADVQNSKLDEQNSLQNEANEQNSQYHSAMVDNGETFEYSDVDLESQYHDVESFSGSILEDLGAWLSDARFIRGLQSFGTFFTLFLDGVQTDDNINWIYGLIVTSIALSTVLLILSTSLFSKRGGRGKHD